MSNITSRTVAVIGCGTLGTAITTGMLDPLDKTNSPGIKHLIATVGTDTSKQRVEEAFQPNNLRAIQEADTILFTVKPVKREEVFRAPGVRQALREKLILSIMAGITTGEVRRLVLGGQEEREEPLQIVRTMPNMAARIRSGTALSTTNLSTLTPSNLTFATWIYTQVGVSQFIPETQFDISGVLVGCAGSLLPLAVVAEGVKRSEATRFVMSSALGMMKLVTEAGEHPSLLRKKISSPGG